jgi:hypothetical protein
VTRLDLTDGIQRKTALDCFSVIDADGRRSLAAVTRSIKGADKPIFDYECDSAVEFGDCRRPSNTNIVVVIVAVAGCRIHVSSVNAVVDNKLLGNIARNFVGLPELARQFRLAQPDEIREFSAPRF